MEDMITSEDEAILRNLIHEETKEISHICIHEADLGKLANNCERLINDYYGNGQEGSRRLLTKLSERVEAVAISTAAHTKVIADLVSWQVKNEGSTQGRAELKTETTIANNLSAQTKRDKYWRIATIVGLSLTLIGLILTVIKLYFM